MSCASDRKRHTCCSGKTPHFYMAKADILYFTGDAPQQALDVKELKLRTEVLFAVLVCA